jgi:hypothetical protein
MSSVLGQLSHLVAVNAAAAAAVSIGQPDTPPPIESAQQKLNASSGFSIEELHQRNREEEEEEEEEGTEPGK